MVLCKKIRHPLPSSRVLRELSRGREKERKTRSLVFPQTANGNASLLLSLFSRARAFELLLVYAHAHTRAHTIMASNATTTGGAHQHLQDVSNNDINGTTTARKSTRRTGGGGAQQHQNSNNNNNNVSSMMMMTTDPASKNHNNNNNSINGEKRWQVSARD